MDNHKQHSTLHIKQAKTLKSCNGSHMHAHAGMHTIQQVMPCLKSSYERSDMAYVWDQHRLERSMWHSRHCPNYGILYRYTPNLLSCLQASCDLPKHHAIHPLHHAHPTTRFTALSVPQPHPSWTVQLPPDHHQPPQPLRPPGPPVTRAPQAPAANCAPGSAGGGPG